MRTRIALPFAVVAFACIIGFAPMVEADPVIAAVVPGDVDGHAFTFDVGTNTISGFYVGSCRDCYCGTCGFLAPVQFDFAIPAHTELVGITASFPFEQYAASFFTGGGLILVDPSVDPIASGLCTTSPCVIGNLHMGPGSYHAESGDCWPPYPGMHVGPFMCDYRLDYTVAQAQVPEPSATLFLLGTGLAGLSGFVWWRRRN